MSKVRTRWVAGETPASSAKQNEQTVDYMTPGALILSSFLIRSNVAVVGIPVLYYLGYYPYNPNKSVFDSMLIGGITSSNGVSVSPHYTLNAGTTWTHADLTGTFPAPAPALAGVFTTQEGPGCNIVDLSIIGSFTWIGFRMEIGVDAAADFDFTLFAFLYRTDAFDQFADVDPF